MLGQVYSRSGYQGTTNYLFDSGYLLADIDPVTIL